MFFHPCPIISLSFSWCFTIAYDCCRCFATAHVCYPTLILNIIVRCDVLSSQLLMFHNIYHDILLSFCRFLHRISLLLMFHHRTCLFLLWFSISLLGVMFHRLVWYFIIMLTFYHLIWVCVTMRCLVIPFLLLYHRCWCFIVLSNVLPSWLVLLSF